MRHIGLQSNIIGSFVRKGQVHSVLDDIPGIGSARRKALMRHFLSLDAIRDASVEELAKIPSMNQKAAGIGL